MMTTIMIVKMIVTTRIASASPSGLTGVQAKEPAMVVLVIKTELSIPFVQVDEPVGLLSLLSVTTTVYAYGI